MKNFLFFFLLTIIFVQCSNDKKTPEKLTLLRADREAPLGWVYLTIYADSTFEFKLTGLRSNLTEIYSGKVEMNWDTLFFIYVDSIPKAGKIAIFNDKSVAYIDGDYPERLEIKQSTLKNAPSTKIDTATFQNNTTPLFEDEFVYEFLNSINLFNDSDVIDTAVVKGVYGIEVKELNRMDTYAVQVGKPLLIVSKREMKFYEDESKKAENKNWDLEKLHAKKSYDKYWSKFRKRFNWDEFHKSGLRSFISIGIPIFNRERTIAIIYISRSHASQAGYTSVCKYELKNGKWVETDSSMLSIN